MSTALVVGSGLLAIGSGLAGASSWWWHHQQRKALYQRLADKRQRTMIRHQNFLLPQPDLERLSLEFAKQPIITIPACLQPDTLRQLQAEARQCLAQVERSYIPLHKQGGAVAYEKLHHYAPACLGLYHSPEFAALLSQLIGLPLAPTADHDQSSCSLLVYQQQGDHIQWHYDHNFYQGRHFTVLLSLVNEASQNSDLTQSCLQYKNQSGEAVSVATPPNRLVVFEGAQVLHRVTPAGANELRCVLSMTFASNSHILFFHEVARRIKDTAFYGMRVLWD